MADETAQNESLIEVVPKTLGLYLKATLPNSIKEFYDEFPPANMRLVLPSVSIIALPPEFRPLAVPYLDNELKVPADHLPATQTPQTAHYVVGYYDTRLQVDLWAGSQEERDDLYDAVFNALNPNISPMSLTIKMTEYFNSLCNYLYVGHSLADSEERAQKDEWRATLEVLATCNAIRTKKEFVIEDTVIDLQTLRIDQDPC